MGRLLEALRADSEKSQTALPAKVANLRMSAPERMERFADSQDSQRAAVENIAADESPDAIRERLLALARAEGLPAPAVDTIPDDELHLYAELDDADLLLPLHLRARGLLGGEKNHHHEHREHDHAQS